MTELEQTKQALADRTAELEQVKRVANELAAQVERLREAFNSAVTWEGVREAFKETPAQCIAEIRAQAGREGFIAGCYCGASYNVYDWDNQADYHANQIRQQAKP